MFIRIRLFAAAAEAAGTHRIDLTLTDPGEAPLTAADVRAELVRSIPALESVLARAWFARDEEYAPPDTIVHDGDELAVIPPVSGGETDAEPSRDAELPDVAIVARELSPAEMVERVLSSRVGAVVLFSGTVREFTGERRTLYLEYEAYPDMAQKKMQAIRDECEVRWPGVRMAIWHRVGRLELTETSVLIGCAAPHRRDAFAAGQYAIDTLKRIVPIWKREFYADGKVEWVGPSEPWDPQEKL